MNLAFYQKPFLLTALLAAGGRCVDPCPECKPCPDANPSGECPAAIGPRSDPNDPDRHSQGPSLKGGRLERYDVFLGHLDPGGVIVTDESNGESRPRYQLMPARYQDGELIREPDEFIVEFKRADVDPCTRDQLGTSIGTLPLYTVTNRLGSNLCGDQALEITSLEEIARCDSSKDPQVQLDAFNRVQGLAVAVEGRWDPESWRYDTTVDGTRVLSLACITGVLAKCTHWGYIPWATRGTSNLSEHHRACVRAARAQYKDERRTFTCGRTVADFFDDVGIQNPRGSSSGGEMFEFYWGADGPPCIERPRYRACEIEFPPRPGSCASTTGWKIGIASTPNIPPWDNPNNPRLCPEEGLDCTPPIP